MASAIMRRTGVSGMRSSSAPAGSGWGVAAGAGVLGAGIAGGEMLAGCVSRWRNTSLRVIRPPMPVPAMRLTSRLCSRARRRTAGDSRLGARSTAGSLSAATITGGAGWVDAERTGSAGTASSSWICASTADPPVGPTGRASMMRYEVGAGEAGGADAATAGCAGVSAVVGPLPSSTSAMGAPMGMVSPSWAMIRTSSPDTGEGTSMVTLSVTTSTSGSYRSTRSPGCLSHLPMVPSTTLSPTWGSSIS